MSLITYMLEHELELEAGALGAGYEILKAGAIDTNLRSQVQKFLSGDHTVVIDMLLQMFKHKGAIDALAGEASAIAGAIEKDPELWNQLCQFVKGVL